jgi:hypothetical protein
MRIYRDETVVEKKKKVSNLKKKEMKINEKESYFFLKKYDSKKIKLILYFYKN